MHVDLPDDLFQRLKNKLRDGDSEADVIRRGLDALDWQDKERIAIQEGIDAMNEGRVQAFDEFDHEFRAKNGISPEA